MRSLPLPILFLLCSCSAPATVGDAPPVTPPDDAGPLDAATQDAGSVEDAAAPDASTKPPPAHVMTADYWLPSAMAASCEVAPYLTYVYPLSADYAKYKKCGVKTVIYLTPSMPQTGETEYTLIDGTYADVRAADCGGTPVTTYAGKGRLMDPHAANAVKFYQATIDAYFAAEEKENPGAQPDAIFSDNSDSDYSASATPCSWKGFADWTAATTKVLGQLDTHGAQLFLNALTLPESYSVIPTGDTVGNVVDLLAPSTVSGGEQEGFLYDLVGHADRWSMELDTEIETIAAGKIYWAYSNHKLASVDPASSAGLAVRTYLYASFLLGYEPDHAIFQEWFTTTSGFRVMPETGLVPMDPIQSANAHVGELEVGASGPFVREFAHCYFRGTLVGRCAAVVNPSLASTSVSVAGYSHSVVLAGSDVLDGGQVTFDGPPVTELAAQSAAILVP